MPKMTIEIEEDERQLLILALALTSLLRPGWEPMCREKAVKLSGGGMFDEFRLYNTNLKYEQPTR